MGFLHSANGAGTGQTFPGDNPLTIGPVTFTAAESPEELPIGLKQAIARHQQIGGGVQLQPLGPFGDDITWEGKLRGPTTQPRRRLLKQMAASGQVYSLSYLDESYDVIITEFTAKHLQMQRCDYKITVAVLRDTSGQYSSGSGTNIDQQTQSLYTLSQSQLDTLTTLSQTADTEGIIPVLPNT
jgi:hypothetical protein